MKKLLTTMALVGAMSVAAVCSAAGEGATLTKLQKTAEAFTVGAIGQGTYATSTVGIAPELKAKLTPAAFKNLQSKIATQLGTPTELSFRAFEHFKDADRVIYFGSFSKEKVVAIHYIFNPQGQMASFAFAPIKPAPAKSAPSQPAKK